MEDTKIKEYVGLVWVCPLCNSKRVSLSIDHHSMDYCKCGMSAVDLEEYYTRMLGYPLILSDFDNSQCDIFNELLLCCKEQGIETNYLKLVDLTKEIILGAVF